MFPDVLCCKSGKGPSVSAPCTHNALLATFHPRLEFPSQAEFHSCYLYSATWWCSLKSMNGDISEAVYAELGHPRLTVPQTPLSPTPNSLLFSSSSSSLLEPCFSESLFPRTSPLKQLIQLLLPTVTCMQIHFINHIWKSASNLQNVASDDDDVGREKER